jgi:hypothetical protein
MDPSFERYKLRVLELKQQRRHVVVLTELPKEQPQQRQTQSQCSARTLEGRQCPFKATSGCFCKKHSVMV